ncbi:hypothetical protein pEaSNUABM11_00078 [Erwinia phage pEa_SNUABM_11]|nr:hypothetical protein pEaSNUABM11_00078 [Erwinia phage pEa_SNUABM_11]
MSNNNVYSMRMTGQVIQAIDAYEANHFSKPSKLFERIKKVLPTTGEVALMYVMASSLDSTVVIVYSHDGVENGKNMPIAEKGSLGNLLFLHTMTTSACAQALALQYGFGYAYAFAQKLAESIEAGDQTTYPRYVDRITPNMIGDDLQYDMYRFAMIGVSRDEEYTGALRAMIRYTALATTADTSTNFREVYPVIRYGHYVTFNSYVPFDAQILGPFDDASILPAAKKYGLTCSEAVEVLDEKDRINISIKNGLDQDPEFQTLIVGG